VCAFEGRDGGDHHKCARGYRGPPHERNINKPKR
jgi:hypothetical protein